LESTLRTGLQYKFETPKKKAATATTGK